MAKEEYIRSYTGVLTVHRLMVFSVSLIFVVLILTHGVSLWAYLWSVPVVEFGDPKRGLLAQVTIAHILVAFIFTLVNAYLSLRLKRAIIGTTRAIERIKALVKSEEEKARELMKSGRLSSESSSEILAEELAGKRLLMRNRAGEMELVQSIVVGTIMSLFLVKPTWIDSIHALLFGSILLFLHAHVFFAYIKSVLPVLVLQRVLEGQRFSLGDE